MFVHVVLFTLKVAEKSEAHKQLLADCTEFLSKIPTVKHIWTGNPVPSPRPVVDSAYDLGLCVLFADKAGHDIYQEHPLHLEFIKRNNANWAGVRVMDFQ